MQHMFPGGASKEKCSLFNRENTFFEWFPPWHTILTSFPTYHLEVYIWHIYAYLRFSLTLFLAYILWHSIWHSIWPSLWHEFESSRPPLHPALAISSSGSCVLHSIRSWSRDEVEMRTRRRSRGKKKKKKKKKRRRRSCTFVKIYRPSADGEKHDHQFEVT